MLIFVLLFVFSVRMNPLEVSANPLSFIKFIKLMEVIVFAWLVKSHLNKNNYEQFIFVFSFSLVFQSFLSIAQFFNHASLNGIFWFFGERNFSSVTPGIANASINGNLILRPYGTFSHPNVLAGYLLIGLILICDYMFSRKHEFLNLRIYKFRFSEKKFLFRFACLFFLIITVIFSTFALFLTMSRVAILIWMLFLILNFKLLFAFSKFRIRVFLFLIVFLIVVFLFPRYFSVLTEDKESFVKRIEQVKIAVSMFKDNPFFGVGLNRHLVELPKYLKSASFRDYQPVHNTFLLILAEGGIIRFLLIFLFFLKFSIFNFQFSRKFLILKFKKLRSDLHGRMFLFVSILILSFFDHYFWTTQQGNLMVGLILGIFNLKIKKI